MIAAGIITFMALAWLHFVYEGIIAPTRRMTLRYDVFEQRDRLRELQCDGVPASDAAAVDYIDSLVNSGARLVSSISAVGLAMAEMRIQTDPARRSYVDDRVRTIRRCESDEAKDVVRQVDRAIRTAVFVNSLGLILWLFPLFLAGECVGWLRKSVERLLVIPEGDIRRLFPPGPTIA